MDNEAHFIEPPDEQRKKSSRVLWVVGLALSLAWFAFGLKAYLLAAEGERSLGFVLTPLALALMCAFESIGLHVSQVFQWSFGRVEYTQIDSPQIEGRIRKRYKSKIEEIESIGFVPAFYLGEGYSIAQLLLIFPLIVLTMMFLNGEVLSVRKGRIVVSYPVFASSDQSALAYIFGLGTKFYTLFKDGTLVVNKSFKDRHPEQPGLIKRGGLGTIESTWAAHEQQVKRLEATGKSIDRQTSLEFFAAMINKG